MATRKQPEGVITLGQWLARGLTLAYAGPNATEDERRCANLRYGNELAAREMNYIRECTAAETHARLFALRASRIRREANRQARTEIRSPFGRHIDTDYVAQLQQAAFVLRLQSYVMRSAAPTADGGASNG